MMSSNMEWPGIQAQGQAVALAGQISILRARKKERKNTDHCVFMESSGLWKFYILLENMRSSSEKDDYTCSEQGRRRDRK